MREGVKNKKIYEVIPTPIFATLRDNRQVIQKNLVLPVHELTRTIKEMFNCSIATYDNQLTLVPA
jgi:hypothetical protein